MRESGFDRHGNATAILPRVTWRPALAFQCQIPEKHTALVTAGATTSTVTKAGTSCKDFLFEFCWMMECFEKCSHGESLSPSVWWIELLEEKFWEKQEGKRLAIYVCFSFSVTNTMKTINTQIANLFSTVDNISRPLRILWRWTLQWSKQLRRVSDLLWKSRLSLRSCWGSLLHLHLSNKDINLCVSNKVIHLSVSNKDIYMHIYLFRQTSFSLPPWRLLRHHQGHRHSLRQSLSVGMEWRWWWWWWWWWGLTMLITFSWS